MSSDTILISSARLRCDLYGFAAVDAAPRTPLVISVLASLLERAIVRSERRGGGDAGFDDTGARVFECDRVLDMSINSFLERIFRYARVSPPIYVVANYPNSYFAKIGGLETVELNGLEVEFLFLMGFKLNVSASVFESYCRHLEREVSFGGGYQIEKCLMKSKNHFSEEKHNNKQQEI